MGRGGIVIPAAHNKRERERERPDQLVVCECVFVNINHHI